MAINKIKYLLAAFIFLALSAQVATQLHAQDAVANEPRLTQRFSWSGGEYAIRYEVIFEQMVNNNFVSHSRQFINQRFIEVSLTIGDYRFRVIPYDVLNRPAAASEWKYFKIIPVPPKVDTAFHPAEQLATESRSQAEEPRELEFVPEYEEEVEPPPEPEPTPEPEPPKQIQPEPVAEIIEPEPELELIPDKKNSYALNSIIFSAGAFASLHFSFYGNEFKEDICEFNFGARFNVVFRLPMKMYIGPELTANFFKFAVMDEYNMYFLAPGINLMALKWFWNERIAVGARFGVSYLYYTYEAFDADNLMPGAGVFFRFRVTPNFNLEAGLDYFHIVNIASGGYIRPWLGVGFQF